MSKNSISFDSDEYPNLDEMYKDVSVVTQILIKNNYEVLFWYDDCGIYVLEYCYSRNEHLGGDCFEICNEEEQELLYNYRSESNIN